MRKVFLLMICLLLVLVDCAGAAIDESSWRKIFDTAEGRVANKHWLGPRPELEKRISEEISKRGEMPKDPVRAEKYVKDYVALNITYYSRVYNGTKIDVEAAKRVLANDDFNEVYKADAQLLLYIDSGKTEDLKKYLMSSRTSAGLFLKVRDPEVAKVVLDIISDAYKERMQDIYGLPGKNAKLIGSGFADYTGIMYKQEGGVIEVAKQLFRDFRLFPNITVKLIPYNANEAARRLYNDVSDQAAEDFIYALYLNGDGESLWNIKQANPELAKLVEKVSEHYKDTARKMFDRVGRENHDPTLVPPTQLPKEEPK